MKRFRDILLLLLVTILTGCDATIHEYPDTDIRPIVVPVTLHLDFSTDLPLYQSIKSTRNNLSDEDFDLRYIVNVYQASLYRQISGDMVAQFVFSKDDVSEWNNTVQFELEKGHYDFVVWADYVDAGSVEDKYYNTSSFSLISINGTLSGSNDYRDAFVGNGKFDLAATAGPYEYTIPMTRPMAKYRFISTDIDSFISRMLALKKKRQEEANRANGEDTKGEDTKGDDTKTDTKVEVNLDDYYVVFKYSEYLNSAYNALMDIAAVPLRGFSFRSSIKQIDDHEAEIGFDYVFVADETSAKIVIEVYEKNGEKVGGTAEKTVPLKRSMLTEVRDAFLTSEEEGGVGIDPDFEDEFTIPI